MTKYFNDPNDFPNLRLKALQHYAKSWVKAYSDLIFEKISLHPRSLPQTDVERKLSSQLKYVLVFEISNCQNVKDFSCLETYPNLDDKPCVRSLKEIKFMDQFANQQVGHKWHRLFDWRFSQAVYKQPPGENFHREWRSVLKRPDADLDRFIDAEIFWVLYPGEPELPEQNEVPPDTFVFYQKGPTWTIIYEGKELSGLRGKGFQEIYFLVKNQRKIYPITEILKETEKLDPDYLGGPIDPIEFDADIDDGYKKNGTDHRDLIYGKSIEELKKEHRSLKEAVQEAENNNDIPRLEKAKNDLEEFKKNIAYYFGKHGKVRKAPDEFTRAKNRVNKRIERALDQIKKYDKNTFNHFYTAIKNIKGNYHLQYNPDRQINWITKKP